MSGVLTVTTAAEITIAAEAAATAAAIAEAAAAAEAAATAAAAVEAAATTASAAEAATTATTAAEAATAAETATAAAETASAVTEVASAVPEVASAVPEAGSILEASAVPPPPAEPLPPAGLEQIAPAAEPLPPPVEPVPAEPAPILDAVEPAVTPVEAPAPQGQPQMQQVNSSNTFNTETRPGMELTDSGFQPTGEMQQSSGLEQIKAPAPGQSGTLGPNGQVTMPDGSTVPWEQYSQSQGFDPSIKPPSEPNAFMEGLKSVGDYASKHEFQTAGALYMGANALGMFKPTGAAPPPEKKKFENPNPLSANFQGGPYNQPNVYKQQTYNYAAGGIAQISSPVERMAQNALGGNANMYPQSQQERTYFATPTQMPASAEVTMNNQYSGVTMAQGGVARFADEGEVQESPRSTRRYRGDLMGTLDKYSEMIDGKKSAPSTRMPDVGIVNDTDAETRYQDAYTAALTRLKKNDKRANVDVAALPTGIQAGALNLKPQKAAGGGIMQANLGGYASGGNPRLLSGPGDGMSDNIPATINGRQPARLADGEFVVPADVVSHLGNGSTNAGAKKLHQMMDQIRMDRTGKKKQAPAVKPKKYLPK